MDILYEDSDIIVVKKRAGLATQTKKIGEKDLVSELKNHLKGGYVGVIHRLDQPVEGLLVFAKTKKAAAVLSSEVGDKEGAGFSKIYTAIVLAEGEYKESESLTDYICKTKEGMAKILGAGEEKSFPDAKMARLDYKVEGKLELKEKTELKEKDVGEKAEGKAKDEADNSCEILKIRVTLHTGRFHQIRAQLSAAGLPIIGDRKYGTDKAVSLAASLDSRFPFLCASKLCFKHPVSGKNLEFTCDAFHDIIENKMTLKVDR